MDRDDVLLSIFSDLLADLMPASLFAPLPCLLCGTLSQSEVQLRKYRESLGLTDPTGATGAVIPLNEVTT